MSGTHKRREYSEYSYTHLPAGEFATPTPDEPCCMGAAFGGNCTCWSERTAPEQEPIQEGPMPVRRKACHDCAYRSGSPEREAVGGDLPDYGPNRPFSCHQGMPQTVEYVHPSGATMTPPTDDYQPVSIGGRAWLADGRPAEWCAGWAAVNRVRRP